MSEVSDDLKLILLSAKAKGVTFHAQDGELRYRGPFQSLPAGDINTLKLHKEAVVAFLERKRLLSPRPPQRVSRANLVPSLSCNQHYVASEHFRGRQLPNLAIGVILFGEMSIAALRKGCHALIARHEILRTCYQEGEGQVTPHTIEQWRVGQFFEKLSMNDVDEFRSRKFAFGKAPMMRIGYFQESLETHRLEIVVHPIICDALSLRLLAHELSSTLKKARDGVFNKLPDPLIQYLDWIKWEESWLSDGARGLALEAWKSAEYPAAVNFTDGYPVATVDTKYVITSEFTLSDEFAEVLDQRCMQERAPLFALGLAALALVASSWAARSRVTVAVPSSIRPFPELQSVIGPFTELITLCVDCNVGSSFRELLRQIRIIMSQAEESLGARQSLIAPESQDITSYLPRIYFSCSLPLAQTRANAALDREVPAGGVVHELVQTVYPEVSSGFLASYDVFLSIQRSALGSAVIVFEFSKAEFDEEKASRFVAAFTSILERGARGPMAPCEEILAHARPQ